jgi:hypothetical protein
MRILDIITEASVFDPKYPVGYRFAVSTQKGGIAIEIIKRAVKDFDPTETVTKADPSAEPTYVVKLGKNTPSSFKVARKNGEIIEIQGTEGNIEGSFNKVGAAEDPNVEPGKEKPQMPNKGDTAEALLGLSMFAKLLNRSGGNIGQVTAEETWKLLDHARPVNDHDYMVRSTDVGGAKDIIWLRLKVKNTVIMALQNPVMRKKLTAWIQSPINYVNSKEGTEYAEEFYKNGTPDEVGVISDGISANTDKKTDVVTKIKDPKTNTIKREVMPISLKAGHDQFAQHSGSSWNSMLTMFGKLGLTFPAIDADPVKGTQADNVRKDYEELQGIQDLEQKKANRIKAASKVYAKAAQLINNQFTSNASEAKFIQTVAHALRFWATSDDDNVQLVSFGSKGSYDVLQFNIAKLTQTMQQLKLRARFSPGENPKLEVYDLVSGNELFRIRTYFQSTKKDPYYQRNVIEKGPLLSIVADITGRKSQQPSSVAAPVTADPALAKQKTVAKKPINTTVTPAANPIDTTRSDQLDPNNNISV